MSSAVVYPCTCCELCYLEILLGYSCICEMILFYNCYYILCIFLYFAVLYLRMAKVWCRNVIMNFNYSIQALYIFMSRIIYKRLDANHKLIFRKFEKEIKVCTKLSADIQFLTYYHHNKITIIIYIFSIVCIYNVFTAFRISQCISTLVTFNLWFHLWFYKNILFYIIIVFVYLSCPNHVNEVSTVLNAYDTI